MTNLNEMGKDALRAACKEAGISYGKLNNDGMRAALQAKQAPEAPADKVADPATMSYDEVHNSLCPGCGIHLSNGLLTRDDEVANKPNVTLYMEGMTKEYECMGCGHQFGDEVAPYVKPATEDRHTGTGLKIEKNREEKNGVKRPSVGGKCREIWDALDEYRAETGELPTSKTVKELAIDSGWNPNNASIEFYQWRKFHGITGRAK